MLRIGVANPAITLQFVYDEAGHLLGEYSATGVRVAEYVWIDDLLVGVLKSHGGSTFQYVETDHLGTPRAVINPVTNTTVWRWDLTPTAFGDHVADTDPDANGVAYSFNLRYPGQYWNGLDFISYNYYRDYDPRTGRYMQSDPIGLVAGASTYSYVTANPIGFIDPYGLITLPNDPSGLPKNWSPDPSHRDPNGERWTNGTDVLDFHRGRDGKKGWRGKDHWHHDEGEKHYSPGESCPTTDDVPAEEEQQEDEGLVEQMEKATGYTGAALVIYLIISEGSRLFPARNLVPVP